MITKERLQHEQYFHDLQAQQRAVTFEQRPHELSFEDEEYLSHETWIRPAIDKLGDVRGKRVLDLGCGHAMASVVLARRGADVVAVDLSPRYLSEAQRRAEANAVAVQFVHAVGERLPFADNTFDGVWGNAILHHLDLTLAAQEIRRVLKPDGVAVFAEPWGGNPLVRYARRRLTYPGKGHTPDEQPLRQRDVTQLKQVFSQVELQGFQLLSMIRRRCSNPHSRALRALEQIDTKLLRGLPFLQKYCRYVVLTLRS